MGILGFIVFLVVAAVCAWIADYFTPGRVPGGFFAAAIVGVIGAWVGNALMGSFGPSLGGAALVPTILGSALCILLMSLVSGSLARR